MKKERVEKPKMSIKLYGGKKIFNRTNRKFIDEEKVVWKQIN